MNENGTGSKTHLQLLDSPQGSREKLLLLILLRLVLFFSFSPQKSAFYSKAKLQKLEVVMSNSSAALLLGLISFVCCYLLSSRHLQGTKSIVRFLFPHMDTPLPEPQKAAWISGAEMAERSSYDVL